MPSIFQSSETILAGNCPIPRNEYDQYSVAQSCPVLRNSYTASIHLASIGLIVTVVLIGDSPSGYGGSGPGRRKATPSGAPAARHQPNLDSYSRILSRPA